MIDLEIGHPYLIGCFDKPLYYRNIYKELDTNLYWFNTESEAIGRWIKITEDSLNYFGIEKYEKPEKEEFIPAAGEKYVHKLLDNCVLNCFAGDKFKAGFYINNIEELQIIIKSYDYYKLSIFKKEPKVIELRNEKAWFYSNEEKTQGNWNFLDKVIGYACDSYLYKRKEDLPSLFKKFRLEIDVGRIEEEN